eukprot:4812723-Ditylum_brightwellii.AAC.1
MDTSMIHLEGAVIPRNGNCWGICGNLASGLDPDGHQGDQMVTGRNGLGIWHGMQAGALTQII